MRTAERGSADVGAAASTAPTPDFTAPEFPTPALPAAASPCAEACPQAGAASPISSASDPSEWRKLRRVPQFMLADAAKAWRKWKWRWRCTKRFVRSQARTGPCKGGSAQRTQSGRTSSSGRGHAVTHRQAPPSAATRRVTPATERWVIARAGGGRIVGRELAGSSGGRWEDCSPPV